jgi:MFS transporter, ACS family, solute carrier family 17 (sodium-dependent inorganic phosphate cotransporter), other
MIDPNALNANATIVDSNSTSTTTAIPTTTEDPDIVHHSIRFSWTESEKQLILGSFFWGYILTELPGGRLAELVGGHRVFGHSMLWSSVLTLIIPFAANLGVTAMIISRVVLGFLLGASWPAIHPMTAVWIKPMDRSKFISNMMASALGAASKNTKF